jgi:hypothetical protein
MHGTVGRDGQVIEVELDETDGVAVVRPETMRGLSESDFTHLTNHIDHYLEEHDALQGLVIVAKSFPGWEDFKAFTSHLTFIKDHHRAIRKIALVSDDFLLSTAPYLADHFVKAKIRHFPSANVEAAKAWAALEENHSGRFVFLDGYPDNVVAFRAEGVITLEDYEGTLIPAITEKISALGHVKLLYWCGREFRGFSAGAMWDDARFGLTHLGDFSKIAVVSDIEWLRHSVKLFAPLMRAPVQVFHNAGIENAKRWITEA